jgi:hypothetical protein
MKNQLSIPDFHVNEAQGCQSIRSNDDMWRRLSLSWGYHGDDGHCYAENIKLDHPWPEFGTGDVVGCGIE